MYDIKFMANRELLNEIYRNSWSFDYKKFNEFYKRLNEIYNLNSIDVITLCGSYRYKNNQIDFIEKSLVILGYTVFNFPDFHSEYLRLDNNQKSILENVLDGNHKRKIRLSDLIIIVNIDNYIGKSTKMEIEYCKTIGKQFIYYEV
jgi:hypothetical protein